MARSIIHRNPQTEDLNGDVGVSETTETALNGDGRSEMHQSSAAELVAAELAAHRRRWPFLAIGLALGAAASYGLITYLDRSSEQESDQIDAVALASAPVESRDLIEEVEWTGSLLFGDPLTVSGSTGTITDTVPAGTELSRGDVVASVDGQPVVALYGSRPLWRSVSEGADGVDVLLLETNLVALGYDPDVTVSVDQGFTANTELMVERWQEDLGREVTGVVDVVDVVVMSGPGVITGEAVIGSGANEGLGTVASTRSVTDVASAIDGAVTEPLAVGSDVTHGTTLFQIDGVPVVAIDQTQTSGDPVLSVLTSATFTNLELEQALAAGGHDPSSAMTVDGVITTATSDAITQWQEDAGLPASGLALPAYYQIMPAGQTVDEHLLTDEESSAMRPVLTTSTSELRVEVTVAVADADEFAAGQAVTVELADESLVDGVVSEVGQVLRENNQADPTVTIVIGVIADATQELVEGPVTVTTLSEVIEGAMAVPTRSLVSLAEGGFAVEVINADGSTRLVGVEIGSFDDGYVEVVTGDVSVGDDLVVPQ